MEPPAVETAPAQAAEAASGTESATGAPAARKEPLKPGEKKVNGILTRQEANAKALKKKEDKLSALLQKESGKALNKSDRTTKDSLVLDIAKLQNMATTLSTELEAARASAQQLQQHEQLKQAKKEMEAHTARAWSEAGILVLVEERLKRQKEFDNSSDTAASIWPHVHAAVIKRIPTELPETDRRPWEAMRDKCVRAPPLKRGLLRARPWLTERAIESHVHRYQKEYGCFKLWAGVAHRAMQQSGLPRDEVEEKVDTHRRCARARQTTPP